MRVAWWIVDSDIKAQKSALRTWSETIDGSRFSDAVCRHLAAWPPLQGRVLTYLAMGSEIDLAGLYGLDRCQILAPRIDEADKLVPHVYDAARLERHRYGFLEPSAGTPTVPLDTIDVVLVPGRAFDQRGRRLGRGAGYYDRLLVRLPRGVTLVGVTTDASIVDEVPTTEQDMPVDWLATESGIRRAGGDLQASTLRFIDAAVASGIAAAPIRFPEGTKTSMDAARAIGCELGAIAKSLVFRVDGEPVLVICSGDYHIDESLLASEFGGSSAEVVPLSEVREISGFAGGGTPAVGHSRQLQTVVDTSLGRYRWVWSAAGTPDTVYPLSLARLVAATNARVATIARKG